MITSNQEHWNPLLIAGLDGRMDILVAFVEAGLPVNVREVRGGEIPLISVARRNFRPGVQTLLKHGAAIGYLQVQNGEVPLLSGTLETMAEMCTHTDEFRAPVLWIVRRLQEIGVQLQELGTSAPPRDGLTTFAEVIFRMCQVLFQIREERSAVDRIVHRRLRLRKLQELRDDLDSAVNWYELQLKSSWKSEWDTAQDASQRDFEVLLRSGHVITQEMAHLSDAKRQEK
ncbi:hypothetical protein FI667_g2861, partial [Globisporangium splendens]